MLEMLEKIAGLKGLIFHSEGLRLYELAQEAPGIIVEIGSLRGKSTCYLAAGANYPVYAIDLWDSGSWLSLGKKKRHPETIYEEFLEQINSMGLANKIIPIKGNSFDIGKAWNKPIGGLFIDGTHTYKGCLRDYKNFAPHVVPGGWIAIHDHVDKHKGIKKVVAEHLKPSGFWENYEQVSRLFVARRRGGAICRKRLE